MVFPPIWGKNGGVLGMRMQVILDSSFARPGSAPKWDGKKGEFSDWTTGGFAQISREKKNFRYFIWFELIGPLQDPVTWYGISYTGTQMTQ